MAFPHHDPHWTDVSVFLHKHVRSGDTILAPDTFWCMFDSIFRYLNTFLDPRRDYDFAVIHKGEIPHLAPQVLHRAMTLGQCVLANPVFVILSSRKDLAIIDSRSTHLRALQHRLSSTTAQDYERGRIEMMRDGTVLPDPGRITKFEALDDVDLKTAMNWFWERGGYHYTTLRDQTYYRQIDEHVTQFGSHWSGERILDLACGKGRLPSAVTARNEVVGVDISEVAIRKAWESDSKTAYAVMDCHRLGFSAQTFAGVAFIDAIEHVRDAPAVLSEIARVLMPRGELIVTVANRNSVHQIIARKLGFPEFKTNYQHIREFTFDEIRSLLDDRGFVIKDAKGIFLYPFWGIPLLDDAVRQMTDEDTEIVELMALLGERVGPEYAYSFTVRAVNNN